MAFRQCKQFTPLVITPSLTSLGGREKDFIPSYYRSARNSNWARYEHRYGGLYVTMGEVAIRYDKLRPGKRVSAIRRISVRADEETSAPRVLRSIAHPPDLDHRMARRRSCRISASGKTIGRTHIAVNVSKLPEHRQPDANLVAISAARRLKNQSVRRRKKADLITIARSYQLT